MSDAWVMNAGKASTAVGTATIEADDELFTIVGHGLGVGDTVMVDTLTGGAVGVLDEGQVYWVVDVSTNTFALSQHRNGAPVAFSSDGGADVYRFAPQFTAIELRRLDSGLLVNDSGDRFGARAGIHPACDPAISVSGTTWTVENIVGVVYPALTSTSGPYRFAHPTESGSLDPADGSNPRIDALDLQIQDNDEDASGQRRARVVYVAGTPASSPSAPAVTSNSLRLGTILVPAGGSPSPSVSDDAEVPFIAATGGILRVRGTSERPTASRYPGMPIWRQDTDALEVDVDGAGDWREIARLGGWTPIGSGSDASVNAVDIDLTAGGRFPAGTFSQIRVTARGHMDADTSPLGVRLNGNGGSIYSRGWYRVNLTTGAIDDNEDVVGSFWVAGEWATTAGCTTEILLFRTQNSNLVTMSAKGTRIANPHTIVHAMGRLSGTSLLVDEIQLRATSGSTVLAELDWWAEGLYA